MKIRSMRWGYDGGGVACGPVEGNTLVEICFTGDDSHNYFVIDSRTSEFERIVLSQMPLFDILMHMMHYDVEFDTESEKYESNALESYDFEIGDEPDDMYESKFAKVIHLARLAMQEYYGNDDEATDAQAAGEFIEPYISGKFDEMELPELEDYDDYDEDEDDEE